MSKLRILKSALIGGTSAAVLTSTAVAHNFNIPAGDLGTALSAYIAQTGDELIVAANGIRAAHTKGVKGELTADVALSRILAGTGFVEQRDGGAVAIVPQEAKPAKRPARTQLAAATPAPAQAGVETVVVTAQKKSENIQQVPIAITALSQAQLTERQIAGGPDLVKEVPNLTFSKTNFTGYNLEIRGIGTQAISVTTDPAVAVAFNDIPFIRNHFFEQEFYDLQDVEVLRGPQGTLYGRNATAGVVNIKSALPTDQYEAMLSADIGNYSNRRLEGMINIPIVGDTLDIRLAGEWTKRDGYTDDTTLNTSVDGRDLFSTRLSIGWKPASNVQTEFVWEHFSEDDDRLRSGKQLCKTAPIPTSISGQYGNYSFNVPVSGYGEYNGAADFLSQGCEDTSLYSPSAFEVPNGYTLPYYAPLGSAGAPTKTGFDVYGETTQSTNLRDIESTILPHYVAKNDTLEFNANWNMGNGLTLTSQTGYNNDYLWSTEDYDRFDSAPGAFVYSNPVELDANYGGMVGPGSAGGVFCDPQLGCSNRLVLEDLSDERAWQVSQEFRLASNYAGPFNFSVGANVLHYETEENYYVFINSLTLLEAAYDLDPQHNPGPALLWNPGVTTNPGCLHGGYRYLDPAITRDISNCGYIDPNPIGSLNNEGHNYFLSQNPYVLNSYAVFGEAYYNLTKDLKLTAGLRFTDDQKHFIEIPSELLIPGYGYPVSGVVDQQWDQFTGRTVLDWSPQLDFTDQTLVYASYSHGYKAGGANPPGADFPTIEGTTGVNFDPIHPLTFKPEFIEAFELGTKNTALDGALTLNGDIFYYNYSNYQISEIEDRTAINNNFNAHMEGAELEMNWEPLPGLKLGWTQGLENTGLAGGDQSVDLMDRTAGNPGWMVVKPFITTASNCILPTYVVASIVEQDSGGASKLWEACSYAYSDQLDPVTELSYHANPSVSAPSAGPIPAGYPGFNPLSAPNNGAGFDKSLGGNQLPNAPHFTTSVTAEYTVPVSDDWAATFHTDFYWQSQQWARVFEDPIDKLHGYSNVNVALTLTSANGWEIMGYVKNVFDTTAITGTFLNSDDTGLTTNVFLTDPRLYGVRVTKRLDQNDGFWGSDYSGYDFINGLFSDTDNGKPPLWIEFGGQLAQLSDGQQKFALPFVSTFAQSPLKPQDTPNTGLDEDAKISYQPNGSDWVLSVGVQYGRAKSADHQHQQGKNAIIQEQPFSAYGLHFGHYSLYPSSHVKFSDVQSAQSESHAIIDFLVGKDVGLGMFGMQGSSVLSGGVRVAQFMSKSGVNLHAEPDVQYPTAAITDFAQKYQFDNSEAIRFHDYAQVASRKESFHGLGPELSWNASTPVSGDEQSSGITFDWGANAAMLIGRQRAKEQHQTVVQSFFLSRLGANATIGSFQKRRVHFTNAAHPHVTLDIATIPTAQHTNVAAHNRSRMVAVPNLGGFMGISWKYQNAKVSFGYRADDFFGAMDGGIATHKAYNEGFNGPYANISIGLGG